MEVRVSILSGDVDEAKDQLKIINNKKIGGHLDVIDGEFDKNKTIRPSDINLDGDWECHLMVLEPINWIEECANARIIRVIGQIEKMSNQAQFVEKVQELQMEAGLAIDLETRIEEIDSEAFIWVDRILVMGVKAGKSGQKFESSVVEKIRDLIELRELRGYGFVIEVDGGVTVKIMEELDKMGVDSVVINSAFWDGEYEV